MRTPPDVAGLDISAINPKLHARYSPNLWAFMGNRGERPPLSVYQSTEGQKWLGYMHDGEFVGVRLMTVLCLGKKAGLLCISKFERELTILPDFWAEYTRRGRCAIDTEHQIGFVGGNERYKVIDGTRRVCQWCGHEQTLIKWEETIERTRWV